MHFNEGSNNGSIGIHVLMTSIKISKTLKLNTGIRLLPLQYTFTGKLPTVATVRRSFRTIVLLARLHGRLVVTKTMVLSQEQVPRCPTDQADVKSLPTTPPDCLQGYPCEWNEHNVLLCSASF